MIKLLKSIFGSADIVEKGLSMLERTGDALVYTEQEKAQHAKESTTEARNMIVQWMETTKGQNLARRLIALLITAVWLFMYICSISLSIVSVWVLESSKWIESAQLIGDKAQQMNGAMMLILAFYFAAPHMGKIVEGAINKFGGNK